ncbi:helix-turn-helix domain-containing protein [Rhizocola hellebori]|uniref:helix-turn-helix domain-containing protein n=1 Tax=Rhizocola hellebori TaxID=1392758 RepID=UPI001EF16BC2|nr:AraC family transcriptional regulator [Rhizocola hellebori]
MRQVRTDTRGIVDPGELMRRVSFRRLAAAEPLRRWVEHYWLIDWELAEPFEQHVVPHPSVNIVFQRYAQEPELVELSGIGLELFSQKLEGAGRVAGVQFRPGGFRPFHDAPVSTLTGRRIALPAPEEPLLDNDDDALCGQRLDAYLFGLDPQPDPLADEAMRMVDAIRADRGIRRVEDFAAGQRLSTRGLQRLFAEYVGVSPKWVILRYRIHEAIELASPDVDWGRLAAELGYSDQAHLVRDFSHTLGVSPTAYTRSA